MRMHWPMPSACFKNRQRTELCLFKSASANPISVRLADLMVERAVTAKDFSNALFLYEKVLREAPQRSDVARKLVELCMRLNRHADALAHAERLLQESPTDGALLVQIGECQSDIGQAGGSHGRAGGHRQRLFQRSFPLRKGVAGSAAAIRCGTQAR